MKINGKAIQIREVVTVTLERTSCEPIVLKVSGFPIGIRREYEKLNPKPVVPKKSTGIVKVGKGEEKVADYEDASYIQAFDDWLFLEKFFYLYHCLAVDENLTFNSNVKTIEGLKLIPAEFKEAGFSEGDIGKLFTAMNEATTIEPKAIEAAAENFSQSLAK